MIADRRRWPVLTLLLAVAVASPIQPAAGATFLGPSEYLSQADSPFDRAAPDFCLETFEDGMLNVPGASSNGSIVDPSNITDSVDADDGTIDGSGKGGHSYFKGGGSGGITITFDPAAPGGLPTEAGMVWTDGAGTVTFEAFGPGGVSLGSNGPNTHPNATVTGETAEDRFYGVSDAGGISAIKLSNTSGGIEIDHVQYNHCGTASAVTTTTTLPGCAGVPDGPSFASLNCRLAALIAAVQGASQLGDAQSKLLSTAQKAKERKEQAESTCGGGDTKTAHKRLKKGTKQLIQFSHRLRSLRSRKRIPQEVRTPLIEDADAIQADMRTLDHDLVCPPSNP